MRWIENSYDSFLEFTAHHWWTIVVPSLALLALTGWMIVERPKAFIPTEDQGYLIVVGPDSRRHQPRDDRRGHRARRARSRRSSRGSSDVVALEGFNLITSTNQTNCGAVFVILKDWTERTRRPSCGRRPGRDSSRQRGRPGDPRAPS